MTAEKPSAERLLDATRELVALSVSHATDDFDRVEGLIKSAVGELAESFLAIEGIVREQRDRLKEAREVLSQLAEDGAEESVQFVVDEQVETSSVLTDAIEVQVSSAMRALQFEDICSQILTGALARLAHLSETIEATLTRNPDDLDQAAEALEAALEQAEDGSSPQQTDLSAGSGTVF